MELYWDIIKRSEWKNKKNENFKKYNRGKNLRIFGKKSLSELEDLIEEIVGEIEDEYDDQDGPQIVTSSGDILEAQARTPIELLEEKLGITLIDEDEDIDTLGGLVFTLAGRVPQRGEVIIHKNGIEFEVRDADPRRIKTLRIRQKKVQVKSEDDAPLAQKLDW